jgi:hypothetical protein
MRKTLIIALFIALQAKAEVPMQLGPTVECRFAAFERDGYVGLDESVPFTMTPGGFVEGDFEPYWFKLASGASAFEVKVWVEDRLVSQLSFPLVQIDLLPVGSSIFGLNFANHKLVEDFDSVQYECIKVY